MIVPKAQKMSSGNYYIRMRLGGKGVTVTEATEKECRHEAERLKAEWLASKRLQTTSEAKCSLTAAIDKYIESKSNVLSPSTIRGYKIIRNSRFKSAMSMDINKPVDWQRIVNAEAKLCGAKTLSNAWGFVAAVVKAETGMRPVVTLPQVIKNERSYLTPEQIDIFVAQVKGNPVEVPALLGLCSLRCSEIVGLKWKNVDLKANTVTVRGSMVRADIGQVYKETNKNVGSVRTVPIMPQLADALRAMPKHEPEEFVVTMKRNKIYQRVNTVCRHCGLPEVGIHGLRHSFASLAYSLGIPYKVAMQIGGWTDDRTMQRIYMHISEKDVAAHAKEMIDFYQRDTQRKRQPLSKRSAHQQTTQQARTTSKSDSAQFRFVDSGTTKSSIYHRQHIQLMSTTGQFRHNASEFLMHFLRCSYIAEQQAVLKYGSRCIVTT